MAKLLTNSSLLGGVDAFLERSVKKDVICLTRDPVGLEGVCTAGLHHVLGLKHWFLPKMWLSIDQSWSFKHQCDEKTKKDEKEKPVLRLRLRTN